VLHVEQCLALPPDGLMVVDCETTGLETDARTIQFGVVFMTFSGTIEGSYSTYLAADGSVGSPEALAVHGIGVEKLRDAPSFTTTVARLAPHFDTRRVVAHRASFDQARLQYEFSLIGNALLPDFYCSKTLCERLGFGQLRLQEAARQFNLEPGVAHDALDDALTVAQIIIRFMSERPCETREYLRVPPDFLSQR